MSNISRTRSRRRIVLATLYTLATGIGVAIAATPGRGPATRGPATANAAANKAAAEAQFNKAKDLFDQGRAAEDAKKTADAQKLYAAADAENEKALALDPSHTNALLLKNALSKKMAALPESTTQGGTTAVAGRVPLLSAAQVSMIRLVDLGPDDARITGTVDRKALEDYWQNVVKSEPGTDTSQAAHDRFISQQNFPIQARRIQQTNDLKYMEKVTITTDPAVIRSFRTDSNIHNYLLQSCAAAECHGGEKGGNFRVINPATSTEQVYTNYYILQMYSNKDGKMIDRANADKSLLLQYGLPWAVATIKHPKVEARKLTGLNDPKLDRMTDWIRNLGLTRPNYHITYEVPGSNVPASAPASAAATGAASQPK
ncbi:MAG TPA: hypothetical protein VHM90_11580 [Phycisphaerae bacterium]|jgi:hypothetical protein|nr:hypothetical protein [Phycisphaerae bacterium]